MQEIEEILNFTVHKCMVYRLICAEFVFIALTCWNLMLYSLLLEA